MDVHALIWSRCQVSHILETVFEELHHKKDPIWNRSVHFHFIREGLNLKFINNRQKLCEKWARSAEKFFIRPFFKWNSKPEGASGLMERTNCAHKLSPQTELTIAFFQLKNLHFSSFLFSLFLHIFQWTGQENSKLHNSTLFLYFFLFWKEGLNHSVSEKNKEIKKFFKVSLQAAY